MTNEELQIAVAEKMGWKYQPHRSGEPATWIRPNGNPVGHTLKELPYYSTSLDAIQAACLERFLLFSHRTDFDRILHRRADLFNRLICELDAEEWCHAFLATCKEIEK